MGRLLDLPMEPYLYDYEPHQASISTTSLVTQVFWMDVSMISMIFATLQFIAFLCIMFVVLLVIRRRTNVSVVSVVSVMWRELLREDVAWDAVINVFMDSDGKEREKK